MTHTNSQGFNPMVPLMYNIQTYFVVILLGLCTVIGAHKVNVQDLSAFCTCACLVQLFIQ